MDEFNKLVQQNASYKEARASKYKVDSRSRLSKIVKKKIKTTMIGALASVEEHFGFLWGEEGQRTSDQEAMYEVFQELRSEILDKGNAQARNVDAELVQYEVEWLKYKRELPMKPRPSHTNIRSILEGKEQEHERE